MPFEVSTPVFEGPFDLLLHLITREQVDIYEVSLSAIVDAYLREMQQWEALDLDVATEFLLIAATLVELKLRRLLPVPEGLELDEELALLEERDLLLAKLLECATFKEAARALQRTADRAALSFPRTAGPDERFTALLPDVLAGVTPDDLRDAYRAALVRRLAPTLAPRVLLDHVTPTRLTVAEVVDELAAALPGRGAVTFKILTGGLDEQVAVIVHFLALLELYKQGWVELTQTANFGDLTIEWRPDGPDSDDGPVPVDDYDG